MLVVVQGIETVLCEVGGITNVWECRDAVHEWLGSSRIWKCEIAVRYRSWVGGVGISSVDGWLILRQSIRRNGKERQRGDYEAIHFEDVQMM